jgi:hypothetical protein
MDSTYVLAEPTNALEPGEPVKIKAIGPYGESKWVSVTPERFGQILALFENDN